MSEIDLIKRIQKLEHDVEQLRALGARDLFLPLNSWTGGSGITVSSTIVCTMPFTRTGMYLNRFQVLCLVATTNNGSNYWNLAPTTLPSNTGLTSANTSAIAADTWSRVSAGMGYLTVSSDVGLYVLATKTGSPGALVVGGVVINAA